MKKKLRFALEFLNLCAKLYGRRKNDTPWCNGSTSGFGPLSSSSNLDGVTIFFLLFFNLDLKKVGVTCYIIG